MIAETTRLTYQKGQSHIVDGIANVDSSEIEIMPEMLESMCGILLSAANRLSSARSHWDSEHVDGEMAFFAATDEVARALNDAVLEFRKNYKSMRKMMPSGK